MRDGYDVLPDSRLNARNQLRQRPEGGRDVGELAGENLVPAGGELWADRRIGSLRQAVAPQLTRRRGARLEGSGRQRMSPYSAGSGLRNSKRHGCLPLLFAVS